MTNAKYLTTDEAAAYLKISISRLYTLTMRKQIPHYKPNGGMMLFDKNELDNWVIKGKQA